MMTPFIILNQKHARSDDVLHILQVNSEASQIQRCATILTSMFCTYKLWTPLKINKSRFGQFWWLSRGQSSALFRPMAVLSPGLASVGISLGPCVTSLPLTGSLTAYNVGPLVPLFKTRGLEGSGSQTVLAVV
jgi:hypothetical protein